MSASELEKCINSLGHWLVFWTLLVAAGLIVEYTKPIKDFVVSVFRWIFTSGNKPHLDHVIIGGLLITIGVAAEGWIEFRTSRAETDLRKVTDAAFADLSSLAKNARNDAMAAQQSAKDATGYANEAKGRALEVAAQAEELRRRTSELNTKFSPRSLTFQQIKDLAEAIKAFGRIKMQVVWPEDGDPEINRFVGQFMMALGGQWDLEYTSVFGQLAPGIQISTSSGATEVEREAATKLWQILRSDGVAVTLDIDPRVTPQSRGNNGQVAMMIGRHPM